MLKGGFNKRKGFNKKVGFRNKTGLKNANSGFSGTGGSIKRNSVTDNRRKNTSNPRWSEIKRTDRVFSLLTRLSSADKQGRVRCFTCSKSGPWKFGGIECGHFISRGHFATRWCTLNGKPQCVNCNQVLGGNLKVYRERLVDLYGEKVVSYVESEANKVVNYSTEDIRQIRLRLEKKLKIVRKEKGL